jgi:diaminopimelate decarboxylase
MLWPESSLRNDAGVLTVGGCPVDHLAEEYGTPLYVFDRATLVNRATRMLEAFRELYPNSRIAFGGKAYLSPTIIKLHASLGIGLDVVSGGELWAAIKAGVHPSTIVFHGNNKPANELRDALRQGIGLIALDNADEIDRLESVAAEVYGRESGLGTKVPVALRLNPGVDVHTHAKISTGVVDSKFGFPLWDASAQSAISQVLASPHLSLTGLHMHLGSQLDGYDAVPLAIDRQVELAGWLKREHGISISTFSPGGGAGIAYTEEGIDTDARLWAQVITSSYLESWRKHDVAPGEIVVEPGRWLIGPAAVALYRVGSIKPIEGVRTYVAIDGGMADNIRPSMYEAVYTAEIVNRVAEGESQPVRIAGRFCESGDVLIDNIALPPVRIDDLIAIPASGAYQLAMASNYNAVPRPAVVLVEDGRATFMRHRETYEDVFRSEVFPA